MRKRFDRYAECRDNGNEPTIAAAHQPVTEQRHLYPLFSGSKP